MTEIMKAVLFGIVQGITEWYPISSTGHMILLEEILPLQFSKAFIDAFFVVIQGSSILAVVILYFDKLWPFGRKKSVKVKREIWFLLFKILVATIPAMVLGLIFEEGINRYLYKSQVVALALVVYGVLFLILEGQRRRPAITKMDELSYSTALWIGLFQVLALVPGTSRSGATILGAVFLGCSRAVASEFSFFLAIPVMVGASLLKLIKTGFAFRPSEWMTLIVGCLTSFLVSLAAVKTLLAYVRRHDFKAFGYYRIVLGFVVILYFWLSGTTLA
ncbi:MAG: undecaprenyl-diphosphate phosphatase [Clostridiales bacterium]|nr:undecaprenyl-diphosphate phosphatase [Clostridiales bacterium]